MCTETSPAELQVPATPRGPGLARAFLASTLCHHVRDLEDEACLVVSTLVTEALRHGASPVRLRAECWTSALALTVEDAGVGARHHHDTLARLLLDRLTLTWACESLAQGRSQWAIVTTASLAAGLREARPVAVRL